MFGCSSDLVSYSVMDVAYLVDVKLISIFQSIHSIFIIKQNHLAPRGELTRECTLDRFKLNSSTSSTPGGRLYRPKDLS